jgi:starch phosphorylase
LAAGGGGRAKALSAWKQALARAWPAVRIISVDTESTLVDLGASKKVEAVVALGQLDQRDVEVQLLHGPVGANEELQPAAIVTMDLVGLDEPGPGDGGEAKNLHRYSGSFACERAGRYGFTVRVVPSHPDLRTFAELGCVAWAAM